MIDKRSEFVFVPLGGVGEIGMNAALYGVGEPHNRQWLMIDCGLGFAGPGLPGVDVVFPDLKFVVEERKAIAGLVITHAHEDHYGALVDLWESFQIPVYMTRFSAGLLRAKQIENRGHEFIDIREIEFYQRQQIGVFEIELLPVSHSIPEAASVVMRTELGIYLHTGDWKLDSKPGIGLATQLEDFEKLGDEGVKGLICDSTNAPKSGASLSESEVEAALMAAMKPLTGRVITTLFASNVARISAVAKVGQALGRKVILAGRALERTTDVAGDQGYLDRLEPFYSLENYNEIPRAEALIIVTGSQGEARAALARIANQSHQRITLSPGDTVLFSSRPIPGNENAVQSIINKFVDQGIDIITHEDAQIHVSGHPRQDELKQLYSAVRPDILVPVHGEAYHLRAQQRFAKSQGLKTILECRNGDEVMFWPRPQVKSDMYPHGQILRDGKLIIQAEDDGVRQRRKLSFSGVIAVSILLDEKGELLDDPDIFCSGLPDYLPNGDSVDEFLLDVASDYLEALPKPKLRDPDHVQQTLQRVLRNEINQIWGKKPIAHVFVSLIDFD